MILEHRCGAVVVRPQDRRSLFCPRCAERRPAAEWRPLLPDRPPLWVAWATMAMLAALLIVVVVWTAN